MLKGRKSCIVRLFRVVLHVCYQLNSYIWHHKKCVRSLQLQGTPCSSFSCTLMIAANSGLTELSHVFTLLMLDAFFKVITAFFVDDFGDCTSYITLCQSYQNNIQDNESYFYHISQLTFKIATAVVMISVILSSAGHL